MEHQVVTGDLDRFTEKNKGNDKQIIEPSTSDWVAPIVSVKKKEGTLR